MVISDKNKNKLGKSNREDEKSTILNEIRNVPCKYVGGRALQAEEVQRLWGESIQNIFKKQSDER